MSVMCWWWKSVFLDNKVNCCGFLWMWLASYQLFTCKRVRLVCVAICRFSSSVGYGCWNRKQFIHELCHSERHMRHPDGLQLTMRCWKSQERMMLVACLGKTPLLFFDFLSSLSNRDARSTLTLSKKKASKKENDKTMVQLSYCCHRNKGSLLITYVFSVARAEEPPQLSPWLPNLSNDT